MSDLIASTSYGLFRLGWVGIVVIVLLVVLRVYLTRHGPSRK